jgi:hypothetical protein
VRVCAEATPRNVALEVEHDEKTSVVRAGACRTFEAMHLAIKAARDLGPDVDLKGTIETQDEWEVGDARRTKRYDETLRAARWVDREIFTFDGNLRRPMSIDALRPGTDVVLEFGEVPRPVTVSKVTGEAPNRGG